MIQIVVGPLTHHDATEAHRVEIRILVLGGGWRGEEEEEEGECNSSATGKFLPAERGLRNIGEVCNPTGISLPSCQQQVKCLIIVLQIDIP